MPIAGAACLETAGLAFQECHSGAKVGAAASSAKYGHALSEHDFNELEEFLEGEPSTTAFDELYLNYFLGGEQTKEAECAAGIEEVTALLEGIENTQKNTHIHNAQMRKPSTQKPSMKSSSTKTKRANRKSIYRGVSQTTNGKWGAKYGGKRIAGASACATAEEAAHAYDAFLKQHNHAKYLRFRNFCGECGQFCNGLHLEHAESLCACNLTSSACAPTTAAAAAEMITESATATTTTITATTATTGKRKVAEALQQSLHRSLYSSQQSHQQSHQQCHTAKHAKHGHTKHGHTADAAGFQFQQLKHLLFATGAAAAAGASST